MIKSTKKQKLAQMGKGSIGIVFGVVDEKVIVGIDTWKNSMFKSDNKESLFSSEICLEFHSVKSLEAMILKLQEARSCLINKTQARVDLPYDITTIYEPNSFLEG